MGPQSALDRVLLQHPDKLRVKMVLLYYSCIREETKECGGEAMEYEDREDRKKRVKEAARLMYSTQKVLQELIGRAMELNPGLTQVEFRGTGSRRLGAPLTLGCVIVVNGDTQEEAEEHCNDMAEQGCICTSTGPTQCECDCGPVE